MLDEEILPSAEVDVAPEPGACARDAALIQEISERYNMNDKIN